MDGIVESARCADSTVVSCSVACVVALLGSLEDLSQGRGLSDEHIEFLSKMKETDNWEILKEQYNNAASARETGISANGRVNGAESIYRQGDRISPDGDIESLTERFEKNGGVWDSIADGEVKNDGKDLTVLSYSKYEVIWRLHSFKFKNCGLQTNKLSSALCFLLGFLTWH